MFCHEYTNSQNNWVVARVKRENKNALIEILSLSSASMPFLIFLFSVNHRRIIYVLENGERLT